MKIQRKLNQIESRPLIFEQINTIALQKGRMERQPPKRFENPAHRVMRSLQRTRGNRVIIAVDIVVALLLLAHVVFSTGFAYVPVVGRLMNFFQPTWLRYLTVGTDVVTALTLLAMALWRPFGQRGDYLWLRGIALPVEAGFTAVGMVFAPNILTIGASGLLILLLLCLYVAFVTQHDRPWMRFLAPYNYDFY